METTISYLVIVFVVGMVFYVEMFMYKQPLTEKEISDYQRELDKVRDALEGVNHRLKLSTDAKTELLDRRNMKKAFALIFSGIGITLVFVAVLIFSDVLSLTNIIIICISAIIMIFYGIIKMSESKTLAVGLLIFILIFGTLAKIAFDKIIEMSPYPYL